MLEFMKLDARPKMSYWGKGIQGHSLMLLALVRVSDLKNFFFFFFLQISPWRTAEGLLSCR